MLSVQAKLQSLSIHGLPELDAASPPILASSRGEIFGTAADGGSFVDVLFETNPIDGKCDTKIDVSARSLETVFDAVCMNLHIYTVNHKKRDILFLTITLAKFNRFL